VQDYVHHLARPDRDGVSPLTTREREVLQLIAEGHAAKVIAARLDIGVRTIETHKRHIMKKIDRRSVAELTKYAISEGLSSLEF
jgi:DNA-binding NarL/FixJ family response regulator